MKKILSMLLIVLLIITGTAGAEAAPTLAERASALAAEMAALAADETTVTLRGASGALLGLLGEWVQGDHTQPRMILAVDTALMTNALTAGVLAVSDVEDGPLREKAEEMLRLQAPSLLCTDLLGDMGANTLAAATAAKATMIFADAEADGSGLFILLYEDATPVMVSWYAQNGAVSMSSVFLPDDGLAAVKTGGEAALWLMKRDWPLPCTEVQLSAVPDEAQALLDAAVDRTVSEMLQLARNRNYVEHYISSPLLYEADLAYVDRVTQGTYAKYLCDVPLAVDMARMTAMAAEQGYNLTGAALDQLYGGESALVLNQAQNIRDAQNIRHHGMMLTRHTNHYASDDTLQGEGAFLRLYEDGVPLLVLWKAEGGFYAVTVQALADEAAANLRTREDVQAWINANERCLTIPEAMAALAPADAAPAEKLTAEQHAVLLAQRLGEIYANADHRELTLGGIPGAGELIDEWVAGDRSQPRMMTGIDLTDAPQVFYRGAAQYRTAVLFHEEASPLTSRVMTYRLPESVIERAVIDEIANPVWGTVAVMMAQAQEEYAAPSQPDGTGMYLLHYDDAVPVAVWWAAQDGAVQMTAQFVPLDSIRDYDSAALVSVWLTAQGLPLQCTEIPLDQ